MPLVWAHAEYLKLAASRLLRRPFDRPESVWQRYRGEPPALTHVIWTEQAPVRQLPQGCALTIVLREPGAVRFGLDQWQDARELETTGNSLGLYLVRIDTPRLRAGHTLDFTFRRGADWAGTDYHVLVTPPPARA